MIIGAKLLAHKQPGRAPFLRAQDLQVPLRWFPDPGGRGPPLASVRGHLRVSDDSQKQRQLPGSSSTRIASRIRVEFGSLRTSLTVRPSRHHECAHALSYSLEPFAVHAPPSPSQQDAGSPAGHTRALSVASCCWPWRRPAWFGLNLRVICRYSSDDLSGFPHLRYACAATTALWPRRTIASHRNTRSPAAQEIEGASGAGREAHVPSS
jgi:hypothetical protein